MTEDAAGSVEHPAPGPRRGAGWAPIVVYVLLRLLLTVVLAAVILGVAALAGLEMPVLVALILALVLQLPLSWLLLGSFRGRATAARAAQAGERQRARAELRAALSGDAQDME